MLKVHHDHKALKLLAEKHANELLQVVKDRLNKSANTFLNDYFVSDTEIKALLASTPRKLISLNGEIYKTLLGKGHLKADIEAAAARVFIYAEFRNRDRTKYRGDDLCLALGFKTCPYCNIRDIEVVQNDASEVIAKHALDHFFADSIYPFLTLSFYNLIPACTTCNTNFKSGTPMKLGNHVHPYIGGFDEHCILDIKNYTDIDDILGRKKGSFDLYLNNVSGEKKYKGSVGLFKLDDQYRSHKEDALKALRKAVNYGPKHIQSMLTLAKANGETPFEAAFGTPFKYTQLHKKPLSKLNRDILSTYGNPLLKAELKIS